MAELLPVSNKNEPGVNIRLAHFCARYALQAVAVLARTGLRSAGVVAGRVVYAPLRSLLDKRSTFHFGRCWTRATGTQQHWRLATQARSAVLYVPPTAVSAAAPVGA